MTAAARIVLAATVGLGVDESYAASVAHPIALSYFDHPPLHFWIAGAAELHRGAGPLADLAVRLPFIALFALTTWLMYLVTAHAFDARAGMYAALALNVSPVFSISTGSWVLPDGPLMCAWLAAVYCILRADDSPRWWLGAGVATGLALLSKYHGVLLMGGIFLYLALAARHWLARPWPYIAALIAIAMFTPVIVWNAEHQWASFAFQLGRNAESHAPRLLALAQNIGGQVAFVTPWVWIPLMLALVRVRQPLFTTLGAIPIALFTLVSLGGNPGQPHWAAPGYLMLFPLLGRLASTWSAARVRVWLITSAAVLVVAATVIAIFAPIDDLVDWRGIPGSKLVLAPSWIQAGKVSWALGPDVPVLCLCTSPHEFAFTHDQRDFIGQDALIVMRPRTAVDMLPRYAPYFASITPYREIHIRGKLVVDVYLARDFQRPFPR
ncbi:MAG TPA: glycosyltransferase family 39 protein [Gemmatimonadaceae bacterium]|nr:glycosyltransferase family 39 protein [Gemmatimonadaceae bacterium]